MRILDWLTRLWKTKGPDDGDQHSIALLAREVRELARAVLLLGVCDGEYADRIRRILGEMEELEAVAAKSRFRRLPAARREELRESLTRSRQRLMQTVQAAPPATELLQ